MTENTHPDDIVIVSAVRTPQGKIMGGLSSLNAVQLGSTVISAAVDRSGLSTQDIDYVFMGQVVQAGSGQNPAKQAAVAAGLPLSVPAETLNKVCLSGLDAIIQGARLIRAGEATTVVAGGQESMSTAPFVADIRAGHTFGEFPFQDALQRDGLTDPNTGDSMGLETDQHAESVSISRKSQDEVAARSHQRAAQATQSGVFDSEIVEVTITSHRGEQIISSDEGIRADSTAERLGKLRPAFRPEGTITAATSSPLSDGAAAVVVTTRKNAEDKGLEILATLGAPGQTAGPSTSLLSQPSTALSQALERQGWAADDLEALEINEAFAAVALESLKDLNYPLDKTNIHGGAIALGHPIGASGARLAVHMAHYLKQQGSGKAGVALCGGGGQGEALLLWR